MLLKQVVKLNLLRKQEVVKKTYLRNAFAFCYVCVVQHVVDGIL
jgi:hypothetical protein